MYVHGVRVREREREGERKREGGREGGGGGGGEVKYQSTSEVLAIPLLAQLLQVLGGIRSGFSALM